MADEVVYILATMEPKEGKKEEVGNSRMRHDEDFDNIRYRSSLA